MPHADVDVETVRACRVLTRLNARGPLLGYPEADRPKHQCRLTLNIQKASATGVQAKPKLEQAESFSELAIVRLVLPCLKTSPVECPLPMLSATASCDDQLRPGRGIRDWQSKHPREDTSKEVAAVREAKTAGGTND